MKVELIVPSDLSEITLKQYQKFLKLQDSNEDSYFLQCKMIEIFCNLEAKNVRMLKVGDANKVVEVLNNMFEAKPDLTRRFKIGGVEYGMIPNLDDISLGEYIDLDTYIGDWQNMQIAMNVLYRPIEKSIGNKYTIVEYEVDAKEKLEEIPMDIVLGSIFFLYNLGIELSMVMVNYLEQPQTANSMHQDIFPLAHIIVNSVSVEEQALRFSITILACDIVDQTKDLTTDRFTGNTNEQDILNTQLAVLNRLIQRLRMGQLHQDMYQLEGNPSLEPFMDRFENQLAGWSASIDILIYNDIYIC